MQILTIGNFLIETMTDRRLTYVKSGYPVVVTELGNLGCITISKYVKLKDTCTQLFGKEYKKIIQKRVYLHCVNPNRKWKSNGNSVFFNNVDDAKTALMQAALI